MLFDGFQRKIDYLRISLTDKCNLRCTYCRPAQGIVLKKHQEVLRLEEIYEIAKYAVSLGIQKIRLTGGEPLVRKNILFLIEKIAKLPGLKDFAMTTNGTLLSLYASQLKNAGLQRVNISLDSLDPIKYKQITRGGDLSSALAGINAARDAGLTPIKLNMVIIPGFNETEKPDFVDFARKNNLEARFIARMNLKDGIRAGVEGQTTVGQCDKCNRLRLTCDGYLMPCLFFAKKIDMRKLGIEQAFALALQLKPEAGKKNEKELMYQIGG